MGRKPTKVPTPTAAGANCRRLREERKWTQAELASRAKLSRATIAKLELGFYRSADLSTIESLASALEVPVELLLAPPLQKSSVAPYMEAFAASPWATALAPTDDEQAWLESLPEIVWAGAEPSAETIALLLQWYRQTR